MEGYKGESLDPKSAIYLEGIEVQLDSGTHTEQNEKKVGHFEHGPSSDSAHQSEESEYSLSEQRSRRYLDPDGTSITDTLVPRRNLTILDVAALIFNKMVCLLWAIQVAIQADMCKGWHRNIYHTRSRFILHKVKTYQSSSMGNGWDLYILIVSLTMKHLRISSNWI